MPLRSLLAALALTAVLAPNAHAIVGGRDAKPGELPFVAHVLIDGAFQCTGTLVTPKHVLTAGHCTSLVPGGVVNVPLGQPGQLVEVTVGSRKTPDGSSTGGERRIGERVDVHPDWLGVLSFSGDASIITLSKPIDSITPVKVPNEDERALWKPGTLATIAGYGVTEEGGDQPDVLQVAQVPIVTDAYAADAYGSAFESRTQLGAGFKQGGVDACQGDSGGPLLVPGPNGAWRLAGDTSYGEGCARPKRPGIYGRLGGDALRKWVASVAPGAVAGKGTSTDGGTQTGGESTAKPDKGKRPARTSRSDGKRAGSTALQLR